MIICPHCGKSFESQQVPKQKWYFSNYWVIIALLCAGPFALPLVWFNPRYKPAVKIIVTILLIAVTIWITKQSIDVYRTLKQQLNNLNLGY